MRNNNRFTRIVNDAAFVLMVVSALVGVGVILGTLWEAFS
jgi:hypothetical protein